LLTLLDEQVPIEFADVLNKAALERHTVRTVAEMGWRGTKNGALLRRMREAGFMVMLTADRHIEHQQNIARSGVGLIVMHPHRVRIQELVPLAPAVIDALDAVRPGEVVHVGP
jgi:rRNA-processing protein FCF1